MSWVLIQAHALLERSRLPVKQHCTDTNPGEGELGRLDKTYSPVNVFGTLGNVLSVPEAIMRWSKITFSCNLKKILVVSYLRPPLFM